MVTKLNAMQQRLVLTSKLGFKTTFIALIIILENVNMATQYWIGDFFIDLTRNQITQKMQSKTIPPKALAVLTCLAKNANKVVTHDELLSEVWPETVVTPNTLQRSIAQLRKALGEDSQSYIKTHAKQGYSLEVEVRWQDVINSEIPNDIEQASVEQESNLQQINAQQSNQAQLNTNIEKANTTGQSAKSNRLLSWPRMLSTMLVVALIVIGIKQLLPTKNFSLSIAEFRLLTATDYKEIGAVYSPNGKYVVFLRYSKDVCVNSHIWARNIETQQETRLTKSMAHYGEPSFSPDSKTLAFIKAENCNKPVTQNDCYKLMDLDFDKALTGPQEPNVILECKNSRIGTPIWLNNDNIALLQQDIQNRKLVNYSITKNSSEVIYQVEDGNLMDFNYSAKNNLIAVISTHNDGLNYIEILQPNGKVLSSYPIQYPAEIANSRLIFISFTPSGEQLIFSTGRQLFTLDFNGEITNISVPLDEPMYSPTFHPNGKRMLVIKGVWDSDLATKPLSAMTESDLDNNYSVLERSTVEEENGVYQPQGEYIAYKSERSGEDQIFISNNEQTKQLTRFPIDTYIYGLVWAADGNSLLVNANNVISRIYLDSKQNNYPIEHNIIQLYDWDSVNNIALVKARVKGKLKLGEVNLNTSEFRVLSNKRVNWAVKTADGQLIYTDHMDRFWQSGPVEDQLITVLNNQGSNKRFIRKNNLIYGVNKALKLWSYDVNNADFTLLGDMPNNLNYLTDVNDTNILFSLRIVSKKEVAEFILND